MIRDLKPYGAYRDTRTPWLGEMPEHWGIRRLRYVLRENDSRSTEGNEQLLRVSQYTGVTKRVFKDGLDQPDTRAESLIGYKRVQPDNLVVNIMLAWNGSLGVSPYSGITSPAYCVYRFLSDFNPWYFHYLLRSPVYKARIKALSTGVVESRLRLYTDDLYRLESPIPPPEEQAAIVRFLAYIERRVLRYTHAKQELVKLLKEEKQAVIHHAVTRGLEPNNVRLKPCEVVGLGDIPDHWEVLALKRVLRRLIDCEHKTAPAVDESDYRVVRTSAVRNGRLRAVGTYCTTESAYKEWTQRGVPEVGDVIFTREAPAGEACVVPTGQNLCLGQRTVLMKVRPNDYDPNFLVYMIYAGPPRIRIQLASQGSTVGHFNMDDIGWMPVFKPPLAEQREIVEWINDHTRVLDLAIVRAESEISLLREYRTRLIADVVTGKLDVRNAAADLPDEVVTPEELLLADELVDDGEDADALTSEELAGEEVVA